MTRAADPSRYSIGGVVPRAAARPASQEEAAEALTTAARDGLAVVPWGGGVALAHEPAPARYDLALDLSALDRVVEHNPEDQTLTAESGVTIATLRALLAAHRQELPLEAARADRATLGGVLAANASGPRRQRFGSPRDRILGARFALADGTVARSGGKVVKNVAGYGIHRLLCGSRGGLAIILEASLKLAPAPECRVALVFDGDAATLADAARWAFVPRLEPALASVVTSAFAAEVGLAAPAAGGALVIVGLEDDRPRVAEQEAALARALGPVRERREDAEAGALWQRLADLEEFGEPDRARFDGTTRGNTPAAVAELLAANTGPFVFHAPAGRLHWFPERGHERAPAGFTRIDARAPAGAPDTSTVAAPAGVTALRARIRAALDPGAALALGERWSSGGR